MNINMVISKIKFSFLNSFSGNKKPPVRKQEVNFLG